MSACHVVFALVEGPLFAIAEHVKARGLDSHTGQEVDGGLGALLTERHVVLAGSAIIAVTLDVQVHVPVGSKALSCFAQCIARFGHEGIGVERKVDSSQMQDRFAKIAGCVLGGAGLDGASCLTLVGLQGRRLGLLLATTSQQKRAGEQNDE